jgi:hypothetical protein
MTGKHGYRVIFQRISNASSDAVEKELNHSNAINRERSVYTLQYNFSL